MAFESRSSADAAVSTPLADDNVDQLAARLLATRDDLLALDKLAKAKRQERAKLIRTIIDQRGWKHVALLLGVGHARVYAMRAFDSPEDERRGTGCQPSHH